MLDVLQYLGTGLGVVYFAMMSFKPETILLALKISVVSCVILGMYGWISQQYGIAISQTIYVFLNILAIYRWRHKKIK
jgi:hypothetical protein